MKRSRSSDEQIIPVIKENEAGAKVDEVCRRHGISTATPGRTSVKRQRDLRD